MTSTLLTGDRRWAPTRKSSMTVLGKVPKPINLPSQRLENHGLDPNVELVPKGTVTWGSRPSTTVPNAWASSAFLSPNTDGSFGSPSFVNGRPSSGSGTRPSTASSDRSHEPTSSAWGPNSRPSSASGVLVSNQTPIVATRPHSAETRPNSTQLSRFAETPVETPVAWGPTRTAERVGPALSKPNDFSLSSGDFPTLGSDKNSDSQMQRGHSSHGRPGSASGTAATQKEAARPPSAGEGNEDVHSDRGRLSNWKTGGCTYVGGGSSNATWQRDAQQVQPYPCGNILPQPFGAWHNAPIHSPDGVWCRGGTVGGPYRPATSPGSYPIEQYAFYPQFPGRPLPSSEPVPRLAAGPVGCYPKNGESYHHHQPPDSFMVSSNPVIPVRPGVHASSVPYESYCAPPHANFCNSNEREVPVMGMPDQPGVHVHCSNQIANHDSRKFHTVPGGHASVVAKEQDSSFGHETRPGQYRVLLKQHDGLEDKNDAQEKREQSAVGLPHDRGILQGAITREENLQRSNINDERIFVKLTPAQEALSQPTRDREGYSTDLFIPNSSVNESSEADDTLTGKPENTNLPVQDLHQNPVMKKNASLIEKIGGLNSKARTGDGHSGGDEKMKHFKVANKADHSKKVISTNAASTEYASTSDAVTFVSVEMSASTGIGNQMSFSDGKVSPRPSESLAFDTGKSDSSEVGEMAQPRVHKRAQSSKKSTGRDASVLVPMTNAGNDPGVRLLDCHVPKDAAEELHDAVDTAEVSCATSAMDVMDHKAQRAKLKEIAMRRAKELQKEEEERTREQKAKALAKLEELNMRTSVQSSSNKNYDVPPSNDVQHKLAEDEGTGDKKERALAKLEESNRRILGPSSNQKNHILPSNPVQYKQDSRAGSSVKIDAIITGAPGPNSAQNSNSIVQENDGRIKILVGAVDLFTGISSDVSISATQDSLVHDSSLSLGQENSMAETAAHLPNSDLQESNVSKRKQMGSRRRANISKDENLSDKPNTAESMGSPKNPGGVAVPTLSSDSLPKEETSVHPRKRSSRNARNKNRLDDIITGSTLQTSASTKGNLEKGLVESGSPQPLTSVAEGSSDPAQSFSATIVNQDSITSSNHEQSQATEKVHGRVGNQWRPQSNRKLTRNQQAIRPLDKFHGSEAVIWAPVRPSNRNEPSEEISHKSNSESNNHASRKNGHDVQNVIKIKRAEMERYVPKPVAKELSQQENAQESPPFLDQTASGNMTGKLDSGSSSLDCGRVDVSAPGKLELATDTKSGEVNKPNRRGKMRPSWRQRSSAEPSSLQSSSVAGVSDSTKPMMESSYENQSSKYASLPERQPQHDDWGSNNDNLMPTEKITTPAVIKNQGVPSRQRRQQSVAHRVEGSNYSLIDNKDIQSRRDDKIDAQSVVLDLNGSDQRNVSRSKNQNVGEHVRWLPKSQTFSQNYNHENRGDGEQRIAPQGVRFDESQSQSNENYPEQNDYNSVPFPRTSEAEKRNALHQEVYREKNVVMEQSKEKSLPANQDLLTNAVVAPVEASAQHEQPVSSAPRRQGPYSGRFGREHEATHRDRDISQDAGKQILHTSGDKQRSNSHFEYQRIGSYNKSGDLFQQNPVTGEDSREGRRAPGLRYRDRGQHHSRRGGHFYGQRSGATVQVRDSYNSGE